MLLAANAHLGSKKYAIFLPPPPRERQYRFNYESEANTKSTASRFTTSLTSGRPVPMASTLSTLARPGTYQAPTDVTPVASLHDERIYEKRREHAHALARHLLTVYSGRRSFSLPVSLSPSTTQRTSALSLLVPTASVPS